MEEADGILISQLSQMGVKVAALDDLQAEHLLRAMIVIFERLSKMLKDTDNFVEVDFLKQQNLSEATHRYKTCQKLVKYLKQLGYIHDLSFNVFLYPNVKETRKLLGFLFEIIFKTEDDATQRKARPTNEVEVLVKRRLTQWTQKPWVLPDFQNGQRRTLLIGGEKISVSKDADFQRVASSQSKAAKKVYQLMAQTLGVAELMNSYKSGSHILGKSIQSTAWSKGQNLLIKGKAGGSLLRGEEFEEDDKKGVSISKTKILVNLGTSLAQVVTSQTTSDGAELKIAFAPSTGGRTGQEKTIRELLEGRDAELKNIETLQSLNQSTFISALASDISNEKSGTSTTTSTSQAKTVAEGGSDVQPVQSDPSKPKEISQESPEVDFQSELKAKFNIEKLREDKEDEIEKLVSELDSLKTDIALQQSTADQLQQQKSAFEEQKKEAVEALKSQSKTVKKKREVIAEIQKLKGQDLEVLQQEVGVINQELEQLKEEWEEYKKPINDEIVEKKQEIADKRVEYQYKQEKIKELKKELKVAVGELEMKKKLLTFMEQEWQTIPKDINRNTYLKRINEIISKMKQHNSEIKKTIQEIRDIQEETTNIVASIKKVDVEVEERVFNDAKKDKIAKDIYKEIVTLKESFDVLVTGVQEENKLKTQIRDIETKMDDFRIQYKGSTEIEKLKKELGGVLAENATLLQKLGGQGK